MAQAELFKIDSPCISVCEMDDKGYCRGCLRNRTERQLWHAMSDEQKRQVLHLIVIRKQKQKIALAKLAKPVLSSKDPTVLSQLTFLDGLDTEDNAEINPAKIDTSKIDISKSASSQNLPPQPALITPLNATSRVAHNPTVSKTPSKALVKTLIPVKESRAKNLDFFAIFEASLLSE